MRAAVMKVIMTLRLTVKILVTNAESASLNIFLSMNPKNVVARWLTSGFNVTCARSGFILYVCLKMLILRMTLFVKTVIRVLMLQLCKFRNCKFSIPFVMYSQLFVNDPLPVISLACICNEVLATFFKVFSTFFC